MSFTTAHPQLRLTGTEDDLSAWREAEQARLAVVKENRVAAHAGALQPNFARQVDPNDPRWILAMQTKSRLQGAMLTPERRDELMRSGKKLGLRPFEANLIIAIVQDQARQRKAKSDAAPLLSLVRPGGAVAETRPAPVTWPKWFAAIAAAAAVAAALIRWLSAV